MEKIPLEKIPKGKKLKFKDKNVNKRTGNIRFISLTKPHTTIINTSPLNSSFLPIYIPRTSLKKQLERISQKNQNQFPRYKKKLSFGPETSLHRGTVVLLVIPK